MKWTDNIAYHQYDKAQGKGIMTAAYGSQERHMTRGMRMAMLFVMLLLTFLSLSCPLQAQNNPYKINDKLFGLYTNAYKYRNSPRGLAMADSLYSQAVVLNDRKAQCLALVVKMLHESNKKENEAKFETAHHRLQTKAKETGYMQYYYYGVQAKVTFLLNEDKSYTAINYLEEEQKEAVKANDKYGIFTCMKAMAQVYIFRFNYLKAKEIYLKAYDYGKVNCPTQDMSVVLYRLAEGANANMFFKDGLEYARKGLKEEKTKRSKLNFKIEEAIALFFLEKKDDFNRVYDEIKDVIDQEATTTGIYDKSYMLKIMKLITDGKYKEAEKAIENESYIIPQKNNLLMEIYIQQNRLHDIILLQKKTIATLKKEKDKTTSSDISELNTRFDNQRLESEKRNAELANTKLSLNNTKLKLQNTQLTLTNSSLELGRVKFAEKMARLNAANYKLNLNNKQLEAKQLKESLKQEHLIQKAKEAEQEAHERVTDITIIALVGLLTLAILYMLYRNKLASQLQEANLNLAKRNDDLKIAKDKAEQADNIKTMFMQNMSHEIRTPLNAIVGFSQVMTEMGDELSPEEKKEMSERIRNNSDLLLTLINDILDITSIESGRYVMTMGDVKVNETMRMTLDTVAHRKASGVELKMETDADEDMTIRTDNVRVKQVLINMLTNAEKNTEHGSITLRFSQKENPGMYTFSVTDTGIGIPRDKMDEIFERFKKLDNFKQGTGLGLNISAVIAQKLGGSIWVDREYTGGARFFFTIKAL